MMREFQLSYGDSDLEIMLGVLTELLDLVDGMTAIASHEERERSARSATKAGGEIRYAERWTPRPATSVKLRWLLPSTAARRPGCARSRRAGARFRARAPAPPARGTPQRAELGEPAEPDWAAWCDARIAAALVQHRRDMIDMFKEAMRDADDQGRENHSHLRRAEGRHERRMG
jgi:hypothetical protein